MRLMTMTVLLLLAACAAPPANVAPERSETVTGEFQLASPAFENGATIPQRFTGDGANVSPELNWAGAPEGVKSFALVCEDPDAPRGTFVHWVLYNWPADSSRIPEGLVGTAELDNGARQGPNGRGDAGYIGPAPPPGKPHRYFFRLYALDTTLVIEDPEGPHVGALRAAMDGHVLAEAVLVGRYGR
jgi:Raf kinase inhibitor-like YbhB/YbcL family protein